MSLQFSSGDHSPNIYGNNNPIANGEKSKATVSNTNKIKLVTKAQYTIIGFILGVLTSFLGSYLFSTCSGPSPEPVNTTQVEK